MTIRYSFVLLFCFYLILPIKVNADNKYGGKPQWVSKGESYLNDCRSNDTYYFKIIGNIGQDLQQLRNSNPKLLAEYIGNRYHISGSSTTETTNVNENGSVSSKKDFKMVFKNEFSSDVFHATLVDEYWETVTNIYGQQDYQYYALYAVSSDGNQKPEYDQFEVTRSYGIPPVFMSIIPGVGQLYKGQKLKGCLMLGGAALGVGSIILCESRRSYYQTRIIEQPKFAREYSKSSNNWETGRNVAIGATAALVVWSIIDAAVTPGTTRIKVSPSTSFEIRPTAFASPDDFGLGSSFVLMF